MGGGDPRDDVAPCGGDDVLAELNDYVFSDPESDEYGYAQDHNNFGKINNQAGNYQDLIDAYEFAGVPVCPNWRDYLAQLGQDNIYIIAQARNDGLTQGVAMNTKKHKHSGQGHVRKTVEKDGSITINSPYNG
jgi:hypothetical protein